MRRPGAVLLKPDLPSHATGDSQRAVLFRVGSTAPTPAFILEDRKLSASKAILLSREPPLSIFAATPPGSHPHHHWRIIHLRYGARNDAQLTISANGMQSSPISPLTTPKPGDTQGLDCALELGGNQAQRDALFMEQLRN